MKIGFIGLGNMGMPMALQLVRAGHEVYGKNRSLGKEEAFVANGGKAASSYTQLAQEMDVVITCLPMPADVEQVYLGAGGLLEAARAGLTFVDCSTVSPELSKVLFDASLQAEVQFLDAPVSGGTTGAASGTLTIMVGGVEETYNQVLPILQAMGKQIHYVGEAGSGSAVKLINQLMVGIHTQATSEALSLAEQFGLDQEQVFQILNLSFAQSKIMERHYSQFIAEQNYEPGFAIRLLSKDLNLAIEAANAKGVHTVMGSRVKALLQRAISEGHGDHDMACMYVYQQVRDQRRREHGDLKHFAVFLPMLDPEKSVTYREEHLAFLSERRQAGMLLANGRFVDGAGGLVIYRAGSQEEVEQWVKQDPYIIHQARSYEIHEWDIVLADE